MAKIPLCVEGKRKGEGGGKGEWRKREGVRLGRKGGKEGWMKKRQRENRREQGRGRQRKG